MPYRNPQNPSPKRGEAREQQEGSSGSAPQIHRLDPAERHYPTAEEMRSAEPASRLLEPDQTPQSRASSEGCEDAR